MTKNKNQDRGKRSDYCCFVNFECKRQKVFTMNKDLAALVVARDNIHISYKWLRVSFN